jgi:hypothetical protein
VTVKVIALPDPGGVPSSAPRGVTLKTAVSSLRMVPVADELIKRPWTTWPSVTKGFESVSVKVSMFSKTASFRVAMVIVPVSEPTGNV